MPHENPSSFRPARRRGRLGICRLLLLACLLLWSGCTGSNAPEVRLGIVATFSGEGFRAGRDTLEAARFAVSQAKKQGRPVVHGQPCRIRIFVRDDRDSPQEADRVVRELAKDERITAIIGPLSSEVAEAAAVAAEAEGVPLVTPSATAAVVTAGRPHIFRITFTDAFQGVVLGRLAVQDLQAKRVVVLANKDNLGSRSLTHAFMEAVRQCGGEVSLFTYQDRDRDFKPVLRQALAGSPDVLFLPNPTSEVVLQGLAARQLGFAGTLLGGDSWNGPQIAGLAAFDGAIFVDHWREDAPSARSRAYAAAFRRALHRPATEVGALTQDAVDVVLAAVGRAGSVAPEAVTHALITQPLFNGVTGRFDFEQDGNPIKSLFITRVLDQGTHTTTIELPPPKPCADGKNGKRPPAAGRD